MWFVGIDLNISYLNHVCDRVRIHGKSNTTRDSQEITLYVVRDINIELDVIMIIKTWISKRITRIVVP